MSTPITSLLYIVKAPHFTAGLTVENGEVDFAAPIAVDYWEIVRFPRSLLQEERLGNKSSRNQ